MSALLENKPEYQTVSIMIADWDKHSGSPIAKELKVTHQATLIMFKDGVELDRVEWSSNEAAIEPLFQAAIKS